MKIENLKFKIYLSLVVLVFIGSISPQKSFAEGISVGIYPPIIQIQAKPPAIINNPITLQNGSDQTITYGIFLMPFKATNERNGEPEFDKTLLTEYSDFFKRVQVSDDNKVITQIKLGPKQTKELNLRISIPREAFPRDYYFSVLFISQDESTSESSFTGARAGVAANVLVTLEPKVKSSGYIKEFSSPVFVTRGPVEFKLNLANTSPHYIWAEGNILIKNMFGQAIGNVDLIPANVLSRSERFLESEHSVISSSPRVYWNENFLIGLYTADLTLRLSDEGPILKDKITFFAFPLELVLGTIIALALVIGIVRRVKRKQSE